jgi:hypothetical protein
MKKVIIGKSKGIAEAKQCDIHVVMLSFWYSIVRCLVLKPLVKISSIFNGRIMGKKKWYERHFTPTIRHKRLNRICYRLTMYVIFK